MYPGLCSGVRTGETELVMACKQLGLEVYVSACSYISSELKQGFKKVLSLFFFFFSFSEVR